MYVRFIVWFLDGSLTTSIHQNKLLQWDANPSANYPWIPNVQEHARHLILHPILGMTLAELVSRRPSASVSLLTRPQEHDGTVVRVYGPPLEWIVLNGPRFPLLQENLRVVVPQLRRAPDASRRGWIQKPPVLFFVWGRLGVRLPHALKGEVKGMDNQGGFPLGDCNAISIRMHVGSHCQWAGCSHSSTFFFFSSRDTSPAPK